MTRYRSAHPSAFLASSQIIEVYPSEETRDCGNTDVAHHDDDTSTTQWVTDIITLSTITHEVSLMLSAVKRLRVNILEAVKTMATIAEQAEKDKLRENDIDPESDFATNANFWHMLL